MARFFVRPEAIEGDRVRFDADETHHLRRVLRLRPGARLEATDGAGRRLLVRLRALGPGGAEGTIEEEPPAVPESPCAITLGQGILRSERMSWLVQKATELGVVRIVPVESARVMARTRADGAADRQARWARVAREAMKQCGRAVAPRVDPPTPFAQAVAERRAHEAGWLFWEGGGIPVAEAARAAGRPRQLLVLVGPEGGFTADEVALARAGGLAVVTLGRRTLRAESAGLVAVALGQHLFGDL